MPDGRGGCTWFLLASIPEEHDHGTAPWVYDAGLLHHWRHKMSLSAIVVSVASSMERTVPIQNYLSTNSNPHSITFHA